MFSLFNRIFRRASGSLIVQDVAADALIRVYLFPSIPIHRAQINLDGAPVALNNEGEVVESDGRYAGSKVLMRSRGRGIVIVLVCPNVKSVGAFTATYPHLAPELSVSLVSAPKCRPVAKAFVAAADFDGPAMWPTFAA